MSPAALGMVTALLAASPASLAAPGRDTVVGEAASVVPAESRLVVHKDGGGEVTVTWDAKTVMLRAKPGATSLEGATPLQPSEITSGDRLLCRGTLDASGGALAANRLVVMTRGDVEARRAREQEDWRKRGMAGVVTAVDPATRQITVRVAQAGVTHPVVVDAAAQDVQYRRYAPASVRFSDSRPGSFDQVAAGDQIRVLGTRSPDGARVTAEQVVSGAFRVVRGTVAEVDPATRTLQVRESGSGHGLVRVAVGNDALVRRLPPMMVMRLLRASEPAGAGASAGGATGGGPATGAGQAAGGPAAAAGAGGRWAGRSSDPDEMLERLPAVTAAEIQKGEEIAVLGPKQDGAAELPAMKVAVWTTPSVPSGRGGGRGRAEAGAGGTDPFADLLGVGGESPW
ncbi:MAG TPA: hypothetical protein VEQ10_04000 [Vicinamibacteria bacterium]|nr:hypothetical protein [Vicinamibacteria bacterium]